MRKANQVEISGTGTARFSRYFPLFYAHMAIGDSSATDSQSKGRGFESRQKRRENFLLQDKLSVLTLI